MEQRTPRSSQLWQILGLEKRCIRKFCAPSRFLNFVWIKISFKLIVFTFDFLSKLLLSRFGLDIFVIGFYCCSIIMMFRLLINWPRFRLISDIATYSTNRIGSILLGRFAWTAMCQGTVYFDHSLWIINLINYYSLIMIYTMIIRFNLNSDLILS